MLIASIQSVLGRLARAALRSLRIQTKMRRNAAAVRHLESLPDYLQRDVGLPHDVAIADVVDGAVSRRGAVSDTHRPLAIEPHAV
jgi:hypothetical protein